MKYIAILTALFLVACNSAEQKKVEVIRDQKCIDNVVYDVLEYGQFMHFENNKSVSC